MNHFYVPKEVVVGVKTDEVSMSKRLGFLSFVEGKKLRKEVSLNGWRDQSVPLATISNKPRSGFLINRHIDHKAYDFGNDRVRFRVYCPEEDGFEFEITPQNLSYILSVCDINKREITQPCVFAWDKGELMLIPVNSQHYIKAMETTDERNNFKEIKKADKAGEAWELGTIIKNKSGNHFVYLGKKKFTFCKKLFSTLKALNDDNLEMVNGNLLFTYSPSEVHLAIPIKDFYKSIGGTTHVPESCFSWEQINPENYFATQEFSFESIKSTTPLSKLMNEFKANKKTDYESEIFDYRVDELSTSDKWVFNLFHLFTPVYSSYSGRGLTEFNWDKNKVDYKFLMNWKSWNQEEKISVLRITGNRLGSSGNSYDLKVSVDKTHYAEFSGSIDDFVKEFPQFHNAQTSFILKARNYKLLTI